MPSATMPNVTASNSTPTVTSPFPNTRATAPPSPSSTPKFQKELNGKGIGSALVRGLLDIVRTQGLKVVPLCPFVASYIAKHPEYADLRR